MRSFQVCLRRELDSIEEVLASSILSEQMRPNFDRILTGCFDTLALAAESGDFTPVMRVCDFARRVLSECRTRNSVYPVHRRGLESVAIFFQKYEQFLGMRIGDLMPPQNFLDSLDASHCHIMELDQQWDAGAPERAAPEAGMGQVLPAPQSHLRKLDILVVDDEDIVRLFLHDILEAVGHRVTTANDGLEAIDCIDRNTFDIIFTDIKMPRADGIQVLKRAKEVCPDTEVVVITGYASLESAAKAVHYGAYDYLAKPFDQTSGILGLVRRIQEAIVLREQNKNLMLELHSRNDELARSVRQLERALKTVEEKQQALIHADRMASLGVLSAGVAHEINNPTTFIRGNLQTLQKFWDTLAPGVRAALELSVAKAPDATETRKLEFILKETPGLITDMLTGTERITKIVSGLRSFVHMGTQSQREPMRLSKAIEEALTLVATESRHSDVTVEKSLPADEPLVNADIQQMTQVFVNLFINALHAMEGLQNSRLRVTVAAVATTVQVTVEDTGCGMDSETLKRAFTPFFTTKPVGRGTGLGLSISLGIIEDHGGTIRAESTPEKGSVFVITLPGIDAADMAGLRRRVLVVDDEETVRNILQQAFFHDGRFETRLASGGFQALEAITQFRPDLAILDIRMADMDGTEVLERIRSNPETESMKVIVITGVVREIDMERIQKSRPDEIIFKPFDLRNILSSVEKLLRDDAS